MNNLTTSRASPELTRGGRASKPVTPAFPQGTPFGRMLPVRRLLPNTAAAVIRGQIRGRRRD